MARNWMGDYDPGNTTGWKNTGQVETRTPSGDTKTTFDTNPDTNPSYNPKAPRANPIKAKEKYLKQNLELKYVPKYETTKYGWKNPIKKHNAWSKKKALDWAKKQEYKKKLGLMELGLSNYEIGQLTGEYEDMAKNVSEITGEDTLSMKNLKDFYGKGTSKYNQGVLDLAPINVKNRDPEKYLDQTPSLDSRITLPGSLGKLQGDVNINNFKSSINRLGQIDNMVAAGIDQNAINDYYDKAMGRGKYNIFGGEGDGNGQQPYIPIDYNTGAATTEDVAEDTTFDYRFGNTQDVGRDVTLGYAANGGRISRANGGIMGLRARKAFGGIMDRVTGRKAYGLGSIFKSVKKAVGKVLKSDVGKAAILGLGIYGYNAGWGSGISSFAKKIPGSGFLMGGGKEINGVAKYADKFNPWKVAGLAMTAAPFNPGPWNDVKPNESLGMNNRGGHLIDPITGKEALPAEMRASLNNALDNADGDPIRIKQINDAYAFLGPDERLGTYLPYRTYGVKDGGRIGKAEGGLMDLGGMEKDYRAEGGFVPIGEYEKKDDVPARLSVNEFVFTADAVRGAGQGDIDKGAEIMENMMVNLEKGGTISEESQGNAGAQQMFNTSERLGEVI